MRQPSRTRRLPFLVALLAAAAGALALTAAACASGYGELSRFGEPAPALGAGEHFFAGKGKIAPILNHAIGVDAADNSVFVLEEPREPEEIEEGAQEGEYRRWYRVQKFGPEGTFVAESPTFELVTSEQEEEGEEENQQDVQGIAIDPGAERLYFLVNEKRHEKRTDEEVETASTLFELSTATLQGAPGTTNGVLAGPEKLLTQSKEASQPLLKPRGLTVDPTTHEAIIVAKIDVKAEKEYHWAVQRITPAGAQGERYVDVKNFLQHTFKVAGISFQGGAPASPVVNSEGRVIVENNFHIEGTREVSKEFFFEDFHMLAEIPAQFAKATEKGEEPTVLVQETRPEIPPQRVAEVEGYEFGGSLALSGGTLYQEAAIEGQGTKKGLKPGVLLRSAASGAVTGWTGGEDQSATSDACVIEPGISEEPLPLVAAGKEGKLFVLAGEYLKPSGEGVEEYKTHKAIIVFGEGGSGCPSDTAEKVVVKEGGKEVSEANIGTPLALSVRVVQSGVISATWEIENLATKKREESVIAGSRFDETVLSPKTFSAAGEYQITVKVHPDDLAGEPEFKVVRTLKVKGGEAPVEVTENPANASAAPGQEATFKATAKGTPTPSVEWLVSPAEGQEFKPDTTDAGHNNETLKVKATLAINGYRYEAKFSNGKTEATSTPAKLTVEEEKAVAPQVTKQPGSAGVKESVTATFTAAASGTPAPTVQWQVSSNGGVSWSDVSEATTTTLELANTTTAENGLEYRAVFTNSAGSVNTEAALLTVEKQEEGEVKGETKEKPAAPKATIAGSSFKVPSNGTIKVKVSCQTKASICLGTVTVKTATAVAAKARKSILTVATASFSIPGGTTTTVTLHLSAKARRALAKAHKLKAKATIASHDPENVSEQVVQTLTLVAAKTKKH